MNTPANDSYFYVALIAAVVIYGGYLVVLRMRERSLVKRAQVVDAASRVSAADSMRGSANGGGGGIASGDAMDSNSRSANVGATDSNIGSADIGDGSTS
ncbi:MAG TPA: hypothetical protein VKZ41_06235 [Gemmatimonadales bacterium]|nr:hypothetical protein [Gemmatimonadales bacterium]